MRAVRHWLLTKGVLRAPVPLPVVAVRLSKRVIMSQSRRPCTNSPDLFCYICGSYTVSRSGNAITEFVNKAYFAYFGTAYVTKISPGFHILLVEAELRAWGVGQKNLMLK